VDDDRLSLHLAGLGLVGAMNHIGRKREQGASLVEAAIVLPILLLIIVGIMELGLAFKDFLTVSYISREGARIGALAGDDTAADCAIVSGLGDLITTGDLARIQEIQIFEADPNTGAQGASYNRAIYNDGEDPTICTSPSGGQPGDGWTITSVGAGYPPTSRGVAVSSTTGGSNLDIIGIRVILTRDWVTGLGPFSGSMNVDESTITRMEPEVYAP
jgi:Flp pilus assembly protein TadG